MNRLEQAVEVGLLVVAAAVGLRGSVLINPADTTRSGSKISSSSSLQGLSASCGEYSCTADQVCARVAHRACAPWDVLCYDSTARRQCVVLDEQPQE